MRFLLFVTIGMAAWAICAGGEAQLSDRFSDQTVTVRVQPQHTATPAGGESAVAIHFQLADDWHLYASPDTAPGGMNLKILPEGPETIDFDDPVMPPSESYYDKTTKKKLQVYSGDFTVYLPFRTAASSAEKTKTVISIAIEGAVCSEQQCRVPRFPMLSVTVETGTVETEPAFTLPPPSAIQDAAPDRRSTWTNYPVWAALGLAFLAGLGLNIMPCVWPVLPLIIMRIARQASENRAKSAALAGAFCAGILLFFLGLAGANIVLRLVYETFLQWGDQFRNPAFVAAMALLLVVLALFCFGVFNIGIPASVTSGTQKSEGYLGAVGTGFLAAILSTPCSFAILAAVFAWAQAQSLAMGTLTILVIGAGMAAPYAVLIPMPGLISGLPRAGRWMELFKQAIGFVLLAIAVKLIGAVPQDRRMAVLYFAVVLGFCVWMWGGWAGYGAPARRRLLVRAAAVAIAAAAGWMLLAPSVKLIAWQPYESSNVRKAVSNNRPVLIKFTADWCLSCQFVEKSVYGRKDIAGLIGDKNVLPVRADTTVADYPATVDLKELYAEPGVPVTILLLPDGGQARYRGIYFGDELKDTLSNLPARQPK